MDEKQTIGTPHSVESASGRISHTEQGTGPVALFVHGVPLNGHLWRHQLAELSDIRRSIAVTCSRMATLNSRRIRTYPLRPMRRCSRNFSTP
jgi:hypothetical protein